MSLQVLIPPADVPSETDAERYWLELLGKPPWRSIAQEPEILLLDEPTSNLDLKHRFEVMDIAVEQTRNGVSTLLAIHDLNLAAKYSDRVLMLKDGEVYVEGGIEILNPENIEPVYNVEIDTMKQNGRRVILPKSSNK